VLTLA
jgi:hypothetical protein